MVESETQRERRSESIVGEPRVRRSGHRRQARTALLVVIFLAAVLVAAYLLFLRREGAYMLTDYDTAVVVVQDIEDTVELSGSVQAREQADITAPEQGFVRRLLVAEGDWVTTGQLLIELDASALQDELDAQERSLASTRRELDRLLLQRQYEIARQERRRLDAIETIADSNEELAEILELFELGAATRSEVSSTEAMVEEAHETLEDLEAEIAEAAGLHELSVESYEDTLESAAEQIVDLAERLRETEILAPIDGLVVSIADSVTVEGALIARYDTLLTIADTRSPLVLTSIEEQYLPTVWAGQPVSVELSAGNYIGAIERVGLLASTTSDGGTPTVDLDVGIDDPELSVVPGSSAVVTILLGSTEDALVLPRGAYLTTGNRRYVFRVEGEQAVRTVVTYGAIKDQVVEIAGGLAAGDIVITSGYQNFIDEEIVELGGEDD